MSNIPLSPGLTPTQRKNLKAMAHALNPVVMIGDKGLTPAVIKEIDASLSAHQLIKVRVAGDDREARLAMLAEITEATFALPVQHIGKLLVLYRANPDKPLLPAVEEKPKRRTGSGTGERRTRERSAGERSAGERSAGERSSRERPTSGRSASERGAGRSTSSRTSDERAPWGDRPARPARGERSEGPKRGERTERSGRGERTSFGDRGEFFSNERPKRPSTRDGKPAPGTKTASTRTTDRPASARRTSPSTPRAGGRTSPSPAPARRPKRSA